MIARPRALIFPAGSEIGMEIYRSLQYSHQVEAWGATGKPDHSSFLYPQERLIVDPGLYIDAPGFVDRFNAVLRAHGISFIYPTHDAVALRLAELEGALAAKVIGSPATTNRLARSKRATHMAFQGRPWCPTLYADPVPAAAFPVFVKPDVGEGGRWARRVDGPDALAAALAETPDAVVVEHLPGLEVSVDCFSDHTGQLLFVGPRTRERVTAGISFRSVAMDADDGLMGIARGLNEATPLRGAWFFQARQDAGGRWKLLEFAPRQASTMGLYRAVGVNFALLSFFAARGLPVEVLRVPGAVALDRCLHNRYQLDWDIRVVYIDLDETLIDGDRTHPRVVAFVYQCRNRGIPVVLITRHRGDLEATLEAHALCRGLFSRVVHVAWDEPKWPHITGEGAIFIDNHYPERAEVHRRLGIPVLDVDAVDCLLE